MTDERAENQGECAGRKAESERMDRIRLDKIGPGLAAATYSRTVFNPVRMMRSMSCG